MDPQSTSHYNVQDIKEIVGRMLDSLNDNDPQFYFGFTNEVNMWIRDQMRQGSSLFDAEEKVQHDANLLLKQYPIFKGVQLNKGKVITDRSDNEPDLTNNLPKRTKQAYTDRLCELTQLAYDYKQEFHQTMKKILVQEAGGISIDCNTKVKRDSAISRFRLLTKVLDPYINQKQKSKQLYTNLEHYFWQPVYEFFTRTIQKNIGHIKIKIYDLLRCRIIFQNLNKIEEAYTLLSKKFGDKIFKVSNKLDDPHQGSVIVNLMFKELPVQVQLSLKFDQKRRKVHDFYYSLTRQKLGMAYIFFTYELTPAQSTINSPQKQTKIGSIKVVPLRQKLPAGYERLTSQQVKNCPDHKVIQSFVKKDSNIALKDGRLVGKQFVQIIKDYCVETIEMFIIHRK